MTKSNDKKVKQLGMPFGTACGRLRKNILFHLLMTHDKNICFHCEKKIETVEELSIEHKTPWLDNDIALFWDMNNVAFSHLNCNCSNGRKHNKGNVQPHGTKGRYQYSECRCIECCKANTDDIRNRRAKKKV